MIELTVYDFLKTTKKLNVFMTVPEKLPKSFYTIEKTGSSLTDHVYKSTFAIRSYAQTQYEAASMNETVKNAMFDMISLDDVSRVSLNSDYNYTDTTTKTYSYQAVFVITHY